MLNRDYYFEFTGMPKTGKTTVIHSLAHYFQRSRGIRIQRYDGGPDYVPIDKSDMASLNMYLTSRVIDFILVSDETNCAPFKIYLLDRGVLDRCIFSQALYRLGKIDNAEHQAVCDFVMTSRITSRIDGVFTFLSSVDASIRRDETIKLTMEPGRVMNTEFLEALHTACITQSKLFAEKFDRLEFIDTKEHEGQIEEYAKHIITSISKITGMD